MARDSGDRSGRGIAVVTVEPGSEVNEDQLGVNPISLDD